MSRDKLEVYKNFTLYEEERDGKFVFYGENADGKRIGETAVNPADVIDPSRNITADIIKKIKAEIDQS